MGRDRSTAEGSTAAAGGERGILEGLRVLDLSMGTMTGAICTMFLADHGAEVIVIESPSAEGKDRATSMRTWGRGKRSLVADLESESDRAVVQRLAADADVIVDELPAREAELLALEPDTFMERNPGVVYCSISALGFSAPGRGQIGHDSLAAARFGVMAESPGHRDGPIFPGHPAHVYGTALIALIGLLSALRAKIVTGVGDHVDATYRDGVLSQLTMNWWSERQVSYIQSKSRTGRLNLGRRRLLLNKYECADGVLVQVHTGANGAFARAMEVLELSAEISTADGPETASELSDEELEVLRVKVPEIMRSARAEVWTQRFWRNEVACLPVQEPGTVFRDEQLVHAQLMADTDDPELGRITTVGAPISFSHSPAEIGSGPPGLDADGDEIRNGGWTSSGLESPEASFDRLPRPLDGVRIVELSNWFASPSGNRLLGDLGAEVIKVEPLSGDPIRPLPNPNDGANGGKQGLAMDLKNPASRPVIEALLRTADVLQHNMRPGAAERLDLAEPRVRELNESIIYSYGPGYGSSGPKSKLQSFAPLLSGFVGVMHLAAGEGNPPHNAFGNEDYYAGLLSATGILLALIHRERTGTGQYVETPQLHASTFSTSEHYLHAAGVGSVRPQLDSTQSGFGPHHRIYQCLIGWICVACTTEEQRRALERAVLGAEHDIDQRSDGQLIADLTQAFFGRPADQWIADLRQVDVPCEVVREEAYLHDFLLTDDHLENGSAVEFEHPLHGRVRVVGELVHLRNRPWTGRRRAPLLGEHSVQVLADAGFAEEEISRLIDDGVIVQR